MNSMVSLKAFGLIMFTKVFCCCYPYRSFAYIALLPDMWVLWESWVCNCVSLFASVYVSCAFSWLLLFFCLIQICFCSILFCYYSVDSCLFSKRRQGCGCTWKSGQENLRGSWEEEMSPEYIIYKNIYSQYEKNQSSKEKRKEKDILLIVVASGTMVFKKGGF